MRVDSKNRGFERRGEDFSIARSLGYSNRWVRFAKRPIDIEYGERTPFAHFFHLVSDRRAIPVKWFMRGLSAALLCVGVLGCGSDNETEVGQLTKTQPLGDPGKANPKAIPTTAESPPKSQEEFFKRQQQRDKDLAKKGGYPAAK